MVKSSKVLGLAGVVVGATLVGGHSVLADSVDSNVGSAGSQPDVVNVSEGGSVALSSADSSLSSLESSVADAQSRVSNQEAVVADAQSSVDKATSVVSDARSTLEGLKSEDSSSSIDEAKGRVSVAESALAKANTDLANAEALKDDTTALKVLEGNLTDSQSTLDVANSEYASVDKEYQETKSEVDVAKGELDKANAELSSVNQELGSINTFTTSDEYVQLVKDYVNASDDNARKAVLAKLPAVAKSLSDANVYKHNEADKAIKIDDLNNLTKEQRIELTQFVVDLTNEFRKPFNVTPAVMTTSSVDVAKAVSEAYVRDKWSFDDVISKGHDMSALKLVGNQVGIPVNEVMNSYDMRLFKDTFANLNMDTLKELTYSSLKNLVYNGYELDHAKSLSGTYGSYSTPLYLGVAWSDDGSTRYGIHINGVAGWYGREIPSGFSTVNIGSSDSRTDSLKAKASELTAKVSDYTKSYDLMNGVLSTLGVKRDKLAQDIEAGKSRVSDAKSALASYVSPVVAYNNAKKVVKEAEANLEEAKSNLSLLEGSVGKREQSILVASRNLTSVETVLVEKQAKLDEAKALLGKYKEELITANYNLDSYKAKASQSAPVDKGNSLDIVDIPKGDAVSKESVSEGSKPKTTMSVTVKVPSATKHHRLETKADSSVSNGSGESELEHTVFYEKGSDDVAPDSSASGVSQSSPASQSKGGLSSSTLDAIKVAYNTGKSSSISTWEDHPNRLPETGDSGSAFTLGASSLALGLGLGLGRKRKEEDFE